MDTEKEGEFVQDPVETFADRLKFVIGGESVNAFAKRVGVSEGVIRQYLKGGTPGLDKAIAIADNSDISLAWLATGRGHAYPTVAVEGFPTQISLKLIEDCAFHLKLFCDRENLMVSPHAFSRTLGSLCVAAARGSKIDDKEVKITLSFNI